MNPLYADLFQRWPTWARIVRSVTDRHPAHVDPRDIASAACALDLDRLAARIFGDDIGSSIEDAGVALEPAEPA